MQPDTFPSGEWYIVDQVDDTIHGRQLHFVFPSGITRWVNIGEQSDTPEFRDRLADAIRSNKRYMKGERISPPPGFPKLPEANS